MASNPFRLDPYERHDQRSRVRRHSRPVSIEDVLTPWLRQNGLSESKRASGGITAKVFKAWDAVIGERLARRAKPARFQKGELVVEVNSMVHLQELQNFTGEAYRQAANQRIGSERIARVSFKLSS